MSCERSYVEDFKSAAADQDWLWVDKDLIPGLKTDLENGKIDGTHMAEAMLMQVDSKNGDMRDVAATVLAELPLGDQQLKEKVIKRMAEQAAEDDWSFAAGRAAAVLLKYRDDEKLKREIAEALAIFKDRARKNDWVEELKENISSLEPLL